VTGLTAGASSYIHIVATGADDGRHVTDVTDDGSSTVCEEHLQWLLSADACRPAANLPGIRLITNLVYTVRKT